MDCNKKYELLNELELTNREKVNVRLPLFMSILKSFRRVSVIPCAKKVVWIASPSGTFATVRFAWSKMAPLFNLMYESLELVAIPSKRSKSNRSLSDKDIVTNRLFGPEVKESVKVSEIVDSSAF